MVVNTPSQLLRIKEVKTLEHQAESNKREKQKTEGNIYRTKKQKTTTTLFASLRQDVDWIIQLYSSTKSKYWYHLRKHEKPVTSHGWAC